MKIYVDKTITPMKCGFEGIRFILDIGIASTESSLKLIKMLYSSSMLRAESVKRKDIDVPPRRNNPSFIVK